MPRAEAALRSGLLANDALSAVSPRRRAAEAGATDDGLEEPPQRRLVQVVVEADEPEPEREPKAAGPEPEPEPGGGIIHFFEPGDPESTPVELPSSGNAPAPVAPAPQPQVMQMAAEDSSQEDSQEGHTSS